MNENTIVAVNNVSTIYSNGKGIRNVSFEINKGDFIALVGSNGAGKSTLINSISGIQKYNSGEITVNNHYLPKKHPYSFIGFSPQQQVIDWYLTVIDNVILGALLAGYKKSEANKLAKEALDIVNLKGKDNLTVDQLSGGQQQRVQIARSIAHHPSFYLLDEPTTGLDAESSEAFLKHLKREVINSSAAALISSHDLSLIEKYCDKIIYIDEGEIKYIGSVDAFLVDSKTTQNYKVKYFENIDFDLAKNILTHYTSRFEFVDNKSIKINIGSDKKISSVINELEKIGLIENFGSEEVSLRDAYLLNKEIGGEILF